MAVIRGTKPTRAVLIGLKRRMKVAQTGHSLLKMKRDGLMIEFFEVLSKAKSVRAELVEALIKSEQRLNMAKAIEGTVAINSVAYAIQKEPTIELESRNIMGVVVPKITADSVQKKMYERGYGIIGTSAAIDEAAESFETLVDKIVLAAEVETAMIRLVEDIDSTKRRVNALEFKVIPDIKDTIKFIGMSLEEMERDNVVKLKMLKGKAERLAAEEEAKKLKEAAQAASAEVAPPVTA
jgi:V/A-type H+-transporting ATPase subunit D